LLNYNHKTHALAHLNLSVSRFQLKSCMTGGGVSGHLRSLAMSPFYRVHMTSYLTLIQTMCLSCTVLEL